MATTDQSLWNHQFVVRSAGDRCCHLCWELSRKLISSEPATWGSSYCQWFATYNYLQEVLPKQDSKGLEISRQAFIGFCATLISDTVSNSLRVVKTYRQVHERKVGYLTAAKAIVAADGRLGLFGRGLKTRIIANGCQGIMFSVLWKLFMDL